MHVPLYEKPLYDFVMTRKNYAPIMGTDEEHIETFPELRQIQHRPTPTTLRFIDYINSEPMIRVLLTGHLHFDYQNTLPGGAEQFITAANYHDCVRELILD